VGEATGWPATVVEVLADGWPVDLVEYGQEQCRVCDRAGKYTTPTTTLTVRLRHARRQHEERRVAIAELDAHTIASLESADKIAELAVAGGRR
jgi:hypothetical protein